MTGSLRGAALCIVLLSVAGAPAAGSSAPSIDGCVRAGPLVRVIRFAAGPGDELAAAVLGHGSAGVVLANESDLDLCAWLPFARVLERSGYRVLAFDYGNSPPSSEVGAAARELHRLGARRVALVGASEGAKASIVAAARTKTGVTAVVSLSAERYLLDVDVKPWAARLRRPILFVAARDDVYAAADTPTLYRACSAPAKSLTMVAGSAHGVGLLDGTAGAGVRREIVRFLAKHR